MKAYGRRLLRIVCAAGCGCVCGYVCIVCLDECGCVWVCQLDSGGGLSDEWCVYNTIQFGGYNEEI